MLLAESSRMWGSCSGIEMATVRCPIDGCEYEGALQEVEAHLSGSTEGEHRGQYGADRRGELVEQIEDELNESEPAVSTRTVMLTQAVFVVVVVAYALDVGGEEGGA